MAKKSKEGQGEFDGAICCRCQLPLHPESGTCPNDRCPFYWGYQDEIVTNNQWPSEEEWQHIKRLRKRMRRKR